MDLRTVILSLLALVGVSGVGFGLHSCATVAGTVVERKTFENSYQKSEAHRTEISMYEAQLAELDAQLSDPNLSSAAKQQLRGQVKAIGIRLKTAQHKYEQVLLKE